MKQNNSFIGWLLPLIFILMLIASIKLMYAQAKEEEKTLSTKSPVTVEDPKIPLDELELLLKPLTVEELEVEANAWLTLLKAKVQEISAAEIAVKYKKKEIDKVEEVEQALEDAEETLKGAKEGQESIENVKHDITKQTKESLTEAIEATQDTEEKTPKDEIMQEAIEAAVDKAKQDVTAEPGVRQQKQQQPKIKKIESDKKLTQIDVKPLDNKKELDEAVEAAQDVAEDIADVKSQLLENLNELREQRKAIIDRTNLAVMSYEAKGGDEKKVDKYRRYAAEVSGIKVDVSDTEAMWITIVGWIKSDEGGIRWAQNIGLFIGIIITFWLLATVVGKATEKAVGISDRIPKLLGVFLLKTVRRTILIIGFFIALSALEINIGPILAVVGAAGFVIAFALQDTLGNFASGLMILLYRLFDVGDVIDVAGVAGTVKSTNLVNTSITTFDNKVIIVPNNTVWRGIITNATSSNTRRVDMVFGISYEDDISKAKEVLESIVKNHPSVLASPAPTIKVHELADSSVNFICRPWAKTEDYWSVYWDVTHTVKERFDEEGICIPFPQRDVHIYNKEPVINPS